MLPETWKLATLAGFFALLAILLYNVQLEDYAWNVLLGCALSWFALEAYRRDEPEFLAALKVGTFLLAFDFIFENAGWIFGLWATRSPFAMGVVPVDVMGIALFGGAAWAFYLPKKFDLVHSALDCLVFASFGALGEWLLIRQGLFVYNLWWTSILAFLAYLGTWMILHYVKYKVLK